jgi:hypothetical protein
VKIRAAILLVVALAGAACSGTVALAPADRTVLGAGARIPVVYLPAGDPWVDCPNDEGERVWSYPDSSLGVPDLRTVPAVWQPRRGGPDAAGIPGLRLADTFWRNYQDWFTAGLRPPPLDPARATADAFLARSRAGGSRLPLAESVQAAEGASSWLPKRFGSGPVLLFAAPRWVLVGCFHSYKPWFTARASLVDAASGRVLWRDGCGGVFPPAAEGEPAAPAELLANGAAHYRSAIEKRAGDCAAELLASLERALDRAGGAPEGGGR